MTKSKTEAQREDAQAISAALTRSIYFWLIKKAMARKTTTYEEIALEFNLPSSGNALGRALSPILGHIYRACQSAGQPYLTAIVVRKSGSDRGMPGSGFWGLHYGFDMPLTREGLREKTQELQDETFSYWARF